MESTRTRQAEKRVSDGWTLDGVREARELHEAAITTLEARRTELRPLLAEAAATVQAVQVSAGKTISLPGGRTLVVATDNPAAALAKKQEGELLEAKGAVNKELNERRQAIGRLDIIEHDLRKRQRQELAAQGAIDDALSPVARPPAPVVSPFPLPNESEHGPMQRVKLGNGHIFNLRESIVPRVLKEDPGAIVLPPRSAPTEPDPWVFNGRRIAGAPEVSA